MCSDFLVAGQGANAARWFLCEEEIDGLLLLRFGKRGIHTTLYFVVAGVGVVFSSRRPRASRSKPQPYRCTPFLANDNILPCSVVERGCFALLLTISRPVPHFARVTVFVPSRQVRAGASLRAEAASNRRPRELVRDIQRQLRQRRRSPGRPL